MADKNINQELAEARRRIAELETQLGSCSCPPERPLEQLILENAPCGMAIVTLDGDILVCNQEAASIIHYTPEELIGTNTNALYVNRKDKAALKRILHEGMHITDHHLPMRCKDGSVIWAGINAKPIDYHGIKAAMVTFYETTDHQIALNRLKLDETRFETLYTLSEMVNQPEKDILNFALEAITKVTSSPVGYIYQVSEDENELKLHAWSHSVMSECAVKSYPEIYTKDDTGLWAESLKRRKPVITNDYESSPEKRGLPEGHIPITRHVSIPVFEDDKIVLLAGVGNKPTGYTQEDVRHLQLVMDGTQRIIHRHRADLALKAAHEQLEAKVRERTAELQQLNKNLEELNSKLIMRDQEREQAQKALIRYERIISSTPDLVSLIDRDYRYVLVNDAYLRRFNRKKEDTIGKTSEEVIGKELFERLTKNSAKKAFSGKTVTVEAWVDFPEGRRFMGITYYPVCIDNDTVDYVSIEAKDLTYLKKKELELQNYAKRLELATDAGGIGIWEWNIKTDKLTWDHSMNDLYQVHPDDFTGLYEIWRALIHPDDLEFMEKALARSMETQTPLDTEFRIIWPDGSVRTIRARATIQTDETGAPRLMTGVNWDVTDQRRMEDDLRRLASTDPLTGASNRRSFMDRLESEFERCKRYRTSMVLLSLDIDHFKKINDTHGHMAGDEVLKQLVDLCLTTLRTTDAFGRVGGEEFLALLTQTSVVAGQKTAERLRQLVEESEVATDGVKINYTISIGLTELSKTDTSFENILKRADDALYQAKNNGRNRVEVL